MRVLRHIRFGANLLLVLSGIQLIKMAFHIIVGQLQRGDYELERTICAQTHREALAMGASTYAGALECDVVTAEALVVLRLRLICAALLLLIGGALLYGWGQLFLFFL